MRVPILITCLVIATVSASGAAQDAATDQPAADAATTWRRISDQWLTMREQADHAAARNVSRLLVEWVVENHATHPAEAATACERLAILSDEARGDDELKSMIADLETLCVLDSLAIGHRVLTCALRVDLLARRAVLARGHEMSKLLAEAEAGARSLVTRDLTLPLERIVQLYSNQTLSLCVTTGDEAAGAAMMAGVRRSSGAVRRRLLERYATWIVARARWADAHTAAAVIDGLYPADEDAGDAPAMRLLARRLDYYYEAARLNGDGASQAAARASLQALGPAGRDARLAIDHFLRTPLGQRGPTFCLDPIRVGEPAHDLLHYRGKKVLLVFINPSRASDRTVWPRIVEAAERYSGRQFALIAIAAGKSAGVSAMEQLGCAGRVRSRGSFLIDQTGSVTRAWGFGVVPGTTVTITTAGVALLEADGTTVARFALDATDPDFDVDLLQQTLRLAIEPPPATSLVRSGSQPRSPGMETLVALLPALYSQDAMPAISRCPTVYRAALVLGSDGVADLMRRLMTLARGAKDPATRKQVMQLWDAFGRLQHR